MKTKWLLVPLTVVLMIFVGCEDDKNTKSIDHSGDMNVATQLLSLAESEFVTGYDIALVYENSSYWVKLNAAANVLAIAVDTTFAAAELPSHGYMTDTSGYYVIGSSWMDPSTYDHMNNHAISSNGTTYFIRTTDYRWIKLEVLVGSTVGMSFKYEVDGDGTVNTVDVEYTENTPVYYNFTSAAEVTPGDWELGFTSMPVYHELSGATYYMPAIMTNFDAVELAVITDQDYADVSAVPSSVTWLTETATERLLGYEAEYEVLTYHDDIHQVLIDNDYVYLIKSGSDIYKIRFTGYDAGVVVFEYDQL